jgi:hypothetical protein
VQRGGVEVKRFVDLGEQLGYDRCFAWYDTIVDQFEDFNGSSHWHTREEFLHDITSDLDSHNVDRYLKLIPKWVP